MADGMFQRRSWWPIILLIQHVLLPCDLTLPFSWKDCISPPWGSEVMLHNYANWVRRDSFGTLAVCMLLLQTWPPQTPTCTEGSQEGALVTHPSESELAQPGTQHMSEEASRWFQPPSHLNVPSQDPKCYAADKRHQSYVVSDFLTCRICDHD